VLVVGFLATIMATVSLRVLARTPALIRLLPFPDARVFTAAVVVPGVAALAYGLVCVPALTTAVDRSPSALEALALGIAVGLATLAAAVPERGRVLEIGARRGVGRGVRGQAGGGAPDAARARAAGRRRAGGARLRSDHGDGPMTHARHKVY